jgi:hypothetical protein
MRNESTTSFALLPFAPIQCYILLMSTVAEIEEAIGRLPAAEREALESRIFSRRFGLDALDDQQRTELLASLDEADREIDEGGGCSPDELRKAVRSWAGR